MCPQRAIKARDPLASDLMNLLYPLSVPEITLCLCVKQSDLTNILIFGWPLWVSCLLLAHYELWRWQPHHRSLESIRGSDDPETPVNWWRDPTNSHSVGGVSIYVHVRIKNSENNWIYISILQARRLPPSTPPPGMSSLLKVCSIWPQNAWSLDHLLRLLLLGSFEDLPPINDS